MKIDIVTPTLSGLVHHTHTMAVASVVLHPEVSDTRHVVQEGMPIIGLARNLAMHRLRPDDPEQSWRDQVWVDADTVLEPDTLTRFLWTAWGLQGKNPVVVAASVPVRNGHEMVELEVSKESPLMPGVFRTNYVGFGLTFVPGALVKALDNSAALFEYQKKTMRDYFPSGVAPTRDAWAHPYYHGEDYGFCRLASQVGAVFCVDTNIKAGHYAGRV